MHLIVLLSALLASLSGYVAGERPAQRAQVELSAVSAVVQQGPSVAQAASRPANELPQALRLATRPLQDAAPVIGSAGHLDLKQSWLI